MSSIYNGQLDAFSIYHSIQEDAQRPAPVTVPALPALGHALSGAAGSAVSNIAVFPLDLIVTRLQIQRQLRSDPNASSEYEYEGLADAIHKIYQQEGGLSAFYSGIVQDTGKSVADAFLFFLAYSFLRERRQKGKSSTTAYSVVGELSIGAAAGAFAKFFTTPIANIVTRKQIATLISVHDDSKNAQTCPSTAQIAKQIHRESGLQGFWSGYSSSLILTLNPSITFFIYELFKRSLIPKSRRNDPGPSLTFLLAALSKVIASSITYPFSLAKARAQASSSPPPDEKLPAASQTPKGSNNPFASILAIYTTEGLPSLYAGLSGSILKAFFSHGTTMLVKDVVHRFIIQSYFILLQILRRYPSPEQLVQRASEAAAEKAESVTAGARDVVERAGKIVEDYVGDVVDESVRVEVGLGEKGRKG